MNGGMEFGELIRMSFKYCSIIKGHHLNQQVMLLCGNLDVGVGASKTSIKAYVKHAGHQGNVEIEAMWNKQGYI